MTHSHGSHEDSRVADEMEPSKQGRTSPSFGIKKMGFLCRWLDRKTNLASHEGQCPNFCSTSTHKFCGRGNF